MNGQNNIAQCAVTLLMNKCHVLPVYVCCMYCSILWHCIASHMCITYMFTHRFYFGVYRVCICFPLLPLVCCPHTCIRCFEATVHRLSTRSLTKRGHACTANTNRGEWLEWRDFLDAFLMPLVMFSTVSLSLFLTPFLHGNIFDACTVGTVEGNQLQSDLSCCLSFFFITHWK